MVDRKQKICFIGSAGVGKTSLVSLLQGKKILSETTPTVGLEIEDSLLDGKRCTIWDLAGQERFQFMWKDFLKSSGLTVLVCESTEESVKKTKEIAERFSNHLGSKVIAIANKQDLDNSISPDNVEKHLGIKTYGTSAIRPEYRARIKEILELEFSSE